MVARIARSMLMKPVKINEKLKCRWLNQIEQLKGCMTKRKVLKDRIVDLKWSIVQISSICFFQPYTIEIVLLVQEFLQGQILSLQSYKESADSFMCTLIPESPPSSSSPHIEYTPGGLIYKPGGSNMQHVTAISFLLLAYAKYLSETSQTVNCGSMTVGPESLRLQAKKQVSHSHTPSFWCLEISLNHWIGWNCISEFVKPSVW